MPARQFKDAAGGVWSLLMSVPVLRQVKDQTKVDLLDVDGETFTKILQDPETLVDVLVQLLADQVKRAKPTKDETALRLEEFEAENEGQPPTAEQVADSRKPGLSPLEFARRMAGDTLDAAGEALLESLIDFFPSRRRGPMRAAHLKTTQLLDQVAAHGTKLIESGQVDELAADVLAEMDRAFHASVSKIRGGSSSGSPALSGSTPNG